MKARLEVLSHKKGNQSFLCYEVDEPAFRFVWHYHPEYELTYIVKGKGQRLVGDSYEEFSEGDLVLLGQQLAHTWVSDTSVKSCLAIVIQFSREFVEPLLAYPEMSGIRRLLEKSGRGLYFDRQTAGKLFSEISKLKDLKGAEPIASFIHLFHQLTLAQPRPLASSYFQPIKGKQNEQRINKVFQYVQNNFTEALSLHQAASMIFLSESAFCKFFKRASGKTFSAYVNDIRIAHACNLLIESDRPISAIAASCGFESLTYFNRVFLRKKKITPRGFREISQAA